MRAATDERQIAVVLAGGRSSRIAQEVGGLNKHLLPIGGISVLEAALLPFKALENLEILIVTNAELVNPIKHLLGGGTVAKNWQPTVAASPRPDLSICDVLKWAAPFVEGRGFYLAFADNIFHPSPQPLITQMLSSGRNEILLTHSDHPRDFGVAEVVEDRVVHIDEKPPIPKSDLVATGLYHFDHRIHDVLSSTEAGGDITAVLNEFAARRELYHHTWSERWFDLGTYERYSSAFRFFQAHPFLGEQSCIRSVLIELGHEQIVERHL